MVIWNDTAKVGSQMLNMPIVLGRRVSTIILSQTKTGFQAVVEHHDVETNMNSNFAKELSSVPEQIPSRRTLTLVFDINQKTFQEAGVGIKDDDAIENLSYEAETTNNISTSAIFVRGDTNKSVESAAFLQPHLSAKGISLKKSSIIFSELFEKKPASCRKFEKARVAFKTNSEPMWREKEKIRHEMAVKENVHQVLNQFIFLEQDDSLMNFPREPRDKKQDFIQITKPKSSHSKSSPNVAPDLLVNIKPFKQYVNKFSKAGSSKATIKKVKSIQGVTRETRPMSQGNSAAEAQKEVLKSAKTGLGVGYKVRDVFSLCLRCGADEKTLRSKGICWDTNYLNSKQTEGLNIQKKNEPCTLCSLWRLYNKSTSGFIDAVKAGVSVDNPLSDLADYDHEAVFKQNLANFRTKINPKSVDFMKSNSSLSFAEIIEFEECKTVKSEKQRQKPVSKDLQKVTIRIIELVKKNDRKSVQFERPKKAVHTLKVVNVLYETPTIRIFESSSLRFTSNAHFRIVKIIFQKIETNFLKIILTVARLCLPPSGITVIFPPNSKVRDNESGTGIERHRSDEFELINIRRKGLSPQFPNQLLPNKIEKPKKAFGTNSRIKNLVIEKNGRERSEICSEYTLNRMITVQNISVHRRGAENLSDSVPSLTAISSNAMSSFDSNRVKIESRSYRIQNGSANENQDTGMATKGIDSKPTKNKSLTEKTCFDSVRTLERKILINDSNRSSEASSGQVETQNSESMNLFSGDPIEKVINKFSYSKILGSSSTVFRCQKSTNANKGASSGLKDAGGLRWVMKKEENRDEININRNGKTSADRAFLDKALLNIADDKNLKDEKLGLITSSYPRVTNNETVCESHSCPAISKKTKGISSGKEVKSLTSSELTKLSWYEKIHFSLVDSNKSDDFKRDNRLITDSDDKVRRSLTLFKPGLDQIQTAIKILNGIAYDFPLRKEGRRREGLRQFIHDDYTLSQEITLLSNRKIEAKVIRKYTENNIMNGMERTRMSKREVITIEGGASAKHLFPTIKNVSTNRHKGCFEQRLADFTINKVDLMSGLIKSDSPVYGKDESLVLSVGASENSQKSLRFPYYKREIGQETCDSSLTSRSALENVFVSSRSVAAAEMFQDGLEGGFEGASDRGKEMDEAVRSLEEHQSRRRTFREKSFEKSSALSEKKYGRKHMEIKLFETKGSIRKKLNTLDLMAGSRTSGCWEVSKIKDKKEPAAGTRNGRRISIVIILSRRKMGTEGESVFSEISGTIKTKK